MCLIGNKIVSTTKGYNVKRHYKTNHSGSSYGKLHRNDKKQKVNQLQKQLNSQRFMFQNVRNEIEKVLRSSF